MINAIEPPDIQARRRALDPEESFICEAPAGSGKTELLTQRILTLLARVPQPEAILAITFTRKAAAEMRERVLHALARGRLPAPASTHELHTWQLAQQVLAADAAGNWQLLNNPNRLQLRTFDSLCAKLTQALPLQSSLGSQLAVSDNPQGLYQLAVEQFLQTIDQPVPWAQSLEFLLGFLDNQAHRLSELLQSMLQQRDAWLPLMGRSIGDEYLRQRLEAHLQEVCDDQVALLQELIPTVYLPKLKSLGAYAANNLQGGKPSPIVACAQLDLLPGLPDASPVGLTLWQGIQNLLLTKDLGWRKRFDVNCGFPPGANAAEKAQAKQCKEAMAELVACLALRPGLLEALADLASLPANTYSENQWLALAAIGELLPILVAHLHLVFRARGEVDFIEIAQRAKLALGDEDAPTDLALRLDHQISHILVDEFQDTSASQYQLLKKLIEGWQPGDGRTLFCVGDAMQSIYSFRAADVGLFLYAKERGLGHLPLTPLQLTTNFRSRAPVVEWINRVFAQAFPARNNFATGAVAFVPAVPFHPDTTGACVTLTSVTGPQSRQDEATAVLQLVQQHRANSPAARIAILVRNRRQGQLIMSTLEQAGLRPLGVDMANLASHPVVQDVVNLCRALLEPSDTIAWLALLRAPWSALTLDDLARVREQPGHSVLEQAESAVAGQCVKSLSPGAQARLPALVARLRQAVLQRLRKPLRLWLEGLWYEIGGPSCVNSQQDLLSVERFWQCLENLQRDGAIPSIVHLNNAVAQLYAAPSAQADPQLQVMTIHKSKGLEFDVVILPGLSSGSRRADKPLLLWQERLSRSGQEQLLLSALSPRHQDLDPIYHHLKQERAKREEYEVCRLVYVAATRAKQFLHLLAEVKPDGKNVGQLRNPNKNTLLAAIWPGVATLWPQPPAPVASSADVVTNHLPLLPLQRLPFSWQPPTLPRGQLLAPYIPPFEFGHNDPSLLLTASDSLPRILGTLIHDILRVMAEQSMAVWRQTPVAQRRPIWRSGLAAAGVPTQQLADALVLLEQQLAKILADQRLQKLLREPQYCRAEWPISFNHKNKVSHLRVDLIWQGQQDAWLVDYKTALPNPGQSLSDFLTREQRAYEPQMQIYRQALSHLGYQKLHMGLYFIGLGEWLEYAE